MENPFPKAEKAGKLIPDDTALVDDDFYEDEE